MTLVEASQIGAIISVVVALIYNAVKVGRVLETVAQTDKRAKEDREAQASAQKETRADLKALAQIVENLARTDIGQGKDIASVERRLDKLQEQIDKLQNRECKV